MKLKGFLKLNEKSKKSLMKNNNKKKEDIVSDE